MNKFLKATTVILLALPVTLLASCDFLTLVSDGPPGEDLIVAWWVPIVVLFLIWGGIAYWCHRAPSLKQSAARMFKALAVVGFLTPVPGFVQWITSGDVKDPIGPLWLYFFIGIVIGIPIALVGIGGYHALKEIDELETAS